ncbi:hypothetical protein MHU86_668 [Fragilaria crotonensis]|nr:hypothetical protein MHU86_668 [Fragilaria crotonensis]
MAALVRIGIIAATRAAILVEKGFQTILDLATVQDEDLDKLPKHVEAWRNPAAAPGAQVRIPFVSFSKLKATRSGCSRNVVLELTRLWPPTSLMTLLPRYLQG